MQILFDIIVRPLIYLIEVVFYLAWSVAQNPGMAIVAVSLFVNLLCLPLYAMADAAQEREREKQKSMEKWVEHIKKHFKGDEQYMMLSAYYEEQGYHPAQGLVSSLSLLLQIPFFMAAYTYLSELELLRGAPFLFLQDLGLPDGALQLGGVAINVLPIVMTLLNVVSTEIYSRGLSWKDKAQSYILAILFLVLLYNSPSGLVFYWTCNQLFSLLKNVFMKLVPNPKPWLLGISQVAVLGAVGFLVLKGKLATPKMIAAAAVALALFELLWFVVLRSKGEQEGEDVPADATTRFADAAQARAVNLEFVLAALFLTLLLGLLIPSALIADSPEEFVTLRKMVNPLGYIVHTACVWGGVFLVWTGVYYALSGRKIKRIFAICLWVLCGVFAMNYFFFGQGLGTITNELVFEVVPSYGTRSQLLNLVLIAVLTVVLVFVWLKANKIVAPALAIVSIATLALAVPDILSINATYDRMSHDEAYKASVLVGDDGSLKPLVHLSKDEKNVVILYMDRMISGYVPFILNERPELREQFDGFTYYPQTISFGPSTNFAAPAMFAGYEYTPQGMDARPEKTIPEKHNEALLLMPTLFSQEGYQTSIVDPPYAGDYSWLSDLSIYDELPNTDAVNIHGAYDDIIKERYGIRTGSHLDRKFFGYGLFKVLPEALQGVFYNGGNYMATTGIYYVYGVLVSEFAVLDMLPELTEIHTAGDPGFTFLYNNTTHSPDYLQLPNYDIASHVDNEGLEDMSRFTMGDQSILMDNEEHIKHYHVNATSFIRLGRWFDWMREQGVYDNTRIIIVADHGYWLYQFPAWNPDDMLDVEMVNPAFLMKDFDSHGFSVSDEFMTNADVPYYAMEGVVPNPINPYTGNPISIQSKTTEDQWVTSSRFWNGTENNGNTFQYNDWPAYTVHGDIHNPENWEKLPQ